MFKKGVSLDNAEVVDNDIVDLEVMPLDDDNATITEAAAKTVTKEEKEEIDTAVEDEETNEEETEEEVSDEVEDDEEVSDKSEKQEEDVVEKKVPVPAAKYIEIDREISSVQKDLKDVSDSFRQLAKYMPEKPTEPEDRDNDEEVAQYRADLAVYKSEMQRFKNQQSEVKDKTNRLALKQEYLFREKYKGEDLSGFENWIAEGIELQTAFYTGSRSLDTLYKWYKVEKGEPEKERKELKTIKKKGIKFEPVSAKAKGDSAATGGNGFPAQYKYANLPMFKELVKGYKGKSSKLTGEKYTPKYIDDLCKQEYKLSKGQSIF